MKFKNIKPFTNTGGYSVHASLCHLKDTLKLFEETGLDMNPDFQRGHVWTEEQQIAYVEYLLRGGLSGRDIYFNCPGWQTGRLSKQVIELVDGKQRLTAALRFLDDEIKVFGHLYSEYEDNPDIMRSRFVFHVNDLMTRKEVLTWYLEMNSGGVVHTEAELDRVRMLLDKE